VCAAVVAAARCVVARGLRRARRALCARRGGDDRDDEHGELSRHPTREYRRVLGWCWMSIESALSSQGLTVGDVDANRAGKVSPTQLERLGSVMNRGRATAYGAFGGLPVMSIALAGYHYSQHGSAGIFIMPAVAIAFSAALYFIVYRPNRLPVPNEVRD